MSHKYHGSATARYEFYFGCMIAFKAVPFGIAIKPTILTIVPV